MIRRDAQHGFTLVELNIALIFVALLLIAVATTTMYAGSMYQKGLSLKTINQTGRQVVEGLRRDIAAAPSSQIVHRTTAGTGRLCLGGVTYLYNTAEALSADTPPQTIVHDSQPIVLARLVDPSQVWCDDPVTLYEIPSATSYTELLPTDATAPLAVHGFALEQQRTVSGEGAQQQALHQMQLSIGTNQKGTVASGRCRPPTDNSANFDYCSVREFMTLIRTRGEG